ncbi:uncharacterized protein FOMMEDRAFT_87529 [Fomitiporia mediterranea MF3/22]|uniref:uncharacterized protein n=1 Tax=Fomitiporia mediterranea (strain MF3/22) TaxID=694068 RepID=UPI000440802B|nr:uncharacterized protein FOMMEDRAFT_87529 [Fomitiporia mediterranea MF3/22]EJD02288.1 hypothetical protein FOMMEDRAFT_87529 [Fomitiporia mediterranea MF3/22]
MKVSFSLSKPKATPTTQNTTPQLKKPTPAFGSIDDDNEGEVDAAPTASSSSNKSSLLTNRTLASQAPPSAPKLSKAQLRRAEEAKKVDETVFEYDEVWDKMQAAKERQKEMKSKEATERKPQHINALLQSARIRKLDRLRAEEKMIQREREAEGDEFADKEQFVTQAYKDQMAEVRRAEEEEKKREEAEKSKRKSTTGMSHFYRQLLEQNDQEHSATLSAVSVSQNHQGNQSKKIKGPSGPETQNLTITKPTDYTPISDLQLAQRAREEGKSVELNDDNQIVDKRDLLSAGLNLSAPNTRHLGLYTKGKPKNQNGGEDGGGEGEVETHRAVGTAASRREINERRRREIEQQLAKETERTAQEKEQKERETAARMVAKRNTEEDVQGARQRYLERKRRKLEEAETAQGVEGQQNENT